MPTQPPLRLGTRGSELALTQSGQVAAAITEASGRAVELVVVTTRGDRIQDRPLGEIGGKGLFTAELEAGLRAGELDLAVHSLKDLPTDDPEGLEIGLIPVRADPRDALVGQALEALAPGAKVGTGSLRRRLQLRALRPDLEVLDIRGNVGTRLAKLDAGQFSAVVLAMAGLDRLGIQRPDVRAFGVQQMVPAAGQGALGVQCRTADPELGPVLGLLVHPPTTAAVAVERAFLAAFGGGCNVAAACHAWWEGDRLRAVAVAEAADGSMLRAASEDARGPQTGRDLAAELRLG